MKITMVKKIYEDGGECKKCNEVQQRLKEGDELKLIDKIVVADVRDHESEGFKIAEKYNVEVAPFFVVEDEGAVTIYKTYMQFKRDVLKKKVESADREIEEKRELNKAVDDIDFL
jgi:hypothetical protein